ncbi:hypothetical protein FGO68_gene10944 [Halteria grandinella]|uniref:Uncharacterized protein n=1 Tax=Halteria grandinella TaxID=5974 RepID=A0A8J8NCG2_HALGN|nr:hypothetical protein FGO68_gene10944 [Halteria grandinella]
MKNTDQNHLYYSNVSNTENTKRLKTSTLSKRSRLHNQNLSLFDMRQTQGLFPSVMSALESKSLFEDHSAISGAQITLQNNAGVIGNKQQILIKRRKSKAVEQQSQNESEVRITVGEDETPRPNRRESIQEHQTVSSLVSGGPDDEQDYYKQRPQYQTGIESKEVVLPSGEVDSNPQHQFLLPPGQAEKAKRRGSERPSLPVMSRNLDLQKVYTGQESKKKITSQHNQNNVFTQKKGSSTQYSGIWDVNKSSDEVARNAGKPYQIQNMNSSFAVTGSQKESKKVIPFKK